MNWTVISLGGSLVYPDGCDTEYVNAFTKLIKSKLGSGNFAIVTGGGKLAREYQDALRVKKESELSNDESDIVGIDATRENARCVRNAFGEIAEPEIFLDPRTPSLSGKQVLIGGGWKPGHSSDGASVELARTLGAKKIINLSNTDYVYTADPRTNPEATPIEHMNWKELCALLPTDWTPGMHAPFDPIAAKMAEELGLEVIALNGKSLENLSNYIDGKEFIGTVISDTPTWVKRWESEGFGDFSPDEIIDPESDEGKKILEESRRRKEENQ
ncbi:MAG: UMP kinase [Candidatus Pacebacteria bacterium]|nr:UMP kinase [Candidatus Paceibacterota bacterium]